MGTGSVKAAHELAGAIKKNFLHADEQYIDAVLLFAFAYTCVYHDVYVTTAGMK